MKGENTMEKINNLVVNDVITCAKEFAIEFRDTIMKGSNACLFETYEWLFDQDIDDSADLLEATACIALFDKCEDKAILSIDCFTCMDKHHNYQDNIEISINEHTFDKRFEIFSIVVKAIESVEKGLYNKIVDYLHYSAIYGLDNNGNPPKYENVYTKSRLDGFVKKYKINPHASIVVEQIDGDSYKTYKVNNLYYDCERDEIRIAFSK